jgi:hypothetical protein
MAAKAKYTVRAREFGRGPALTRKFSTLAALQEYVRARWEGVEYIDGPQSFHNDYCTFNLSGAKLTDLGRRKGEYGAEAFWDWEWFDFSSEGLDTPVQE